MYTLRTPFWLNKLYANAVWKMPQTHPPSVYLTFDDGPHPAITPFVLDLLREHHAKATFFCIGNHAMKYPGVYERILAEGHTTGNHTHQHLNGWKTSGKDYLSDIQQAAQYIDSRLFRPPYGRIGPIQARQVRKVGYHLIMWSLLSADFDTGITPGQCLENVVFNLTPGDIVVFHDSEKAFERMSFALPCVLEHCNRQGWEMRAMNVLKIH